MPKQPKIALVHDYIKEYGGAERVLETLHEMYPDAPVYTILYAPQFLGPHKERFKNWDITPSFLQYIPFSYKFVSVFRLLAPFVFKTFDFSGYDVVIVSATGAYSPNTIDVHRGSGSKDQRPATNDQRLTTSDQRPIHICYCHTPPRYLYGYATAREQSDNPIVKALLAVMLHILRMVDYASSKHVDIFIANSQNVAGRIKKFYKRESIVVYPPVTISSLSSREAKRREIPSSLVNSQEISHFVRDDKLYYLAGGRLARPKHIDLIVKVCAELGINVKVFGRGFAGYDEELRTQHAELRMTKESIAFLGEVTDEEKTELMKNAKAFIFAAEDEDFGILPVEAMSVGTPVIAYRSGGVQESVIDPSTGSGSPTGLFFNELTEESLTHAIKKFGKMKIDPNDCKKQAEKFSKDRFIKEIYEIINKEIKKQGTKYA